MANGPARPSRLSPYARATLEALAGTGLGYKLSLGGALGLQHYLEYRATHDVDAWWDPAATTEEREQVLSVVEEALRVFGLTRLRRGSDTDPHRARLAVETHLSRIAQHRPLAGISDAEQRTAAADVRHFFATELLHALVD